MSNESKFTDQGIVEILANQLKDRNTNQIVGVRVDIIGISADGSKELAEVVRAAVAKWQGEQLGDTIHQIDNNPSAPRH